MAKKETTPNNQDSSTHSQQTNNGSSSGALRTFERVNTSRNSLIDKNERNNTNPKDSHNPSGK